MMKMVNKEYTRLDLIEGASSIRQGSDFTLSFRPRNYRGATIDLSNKTIDVVIADNRGIVFETLGSFDIETGLLKFTVDENIGYGEMWFEITVTDPIDTSFRLKFPTKEHSGRLTIIRGTDDLGKVGVRSITVSQLRQEQQSAQQEFEGAIVPQVENIDAQLKALVVEGDSSPQATQASVGADGTTYGGNLKARLDAEYNQTAGKLADISSDEYRSGMIMLPYRKGLSDRNTFLSVSQNATDFKTVNVNPVISDCADPSIIFYKDTFYVASSDYPVGSTWDIKVSKSKNLSDWQSFYPQLGFRSSGKTTVWAPEWFEDDNGDLYLVVSAGMANAATDNLGNTINDLRIYLSKVIDLENMLFEEARLIGIQTTENTSKIDGAIRKFGGTYQLFVKDEIDKKIEKWTSADLLNWTKQFDSIPELNIFPGIVSASDNYVEAPHPFSYNGKHYLLVDYFVRGHMGIVEANADYTVFSNARPINLIETNRHGTPYVVSDPKAKDILTNYIASNTSVKQQQYAQRRGLKGLTDNADTITEFKPQEGVIYQLNGAENIVINKIMNSFNIKGFSLTIASTGSGSVTLKNVGDIQMNQSELILVSGVDTNTLYEFEWIDASKTFQLKTKQEQRSTVDRVSLSTLATNGVINRLNAREGFVYQVTGTEKITINGISDSSNAKRFYLLVASDNIASITIPSGSSRMSLPSSGLRFEGIYGDGNIIYEFVFDRNAGAYRSRSLPAFNIMISPKWFKSGTADPTGNAEFVGQKYLNSSTNKVYIAKSVTGSWQDWILLN